MSNLTKVAYSLASLAKYIKSSKAAGKIINSRNIGIETHPTSSKPMVTTTKGAGVGPMALTVSRKHAPKESLDQIEMGNIKPAVYIKGSGAKTISNIVKEHHDLMSKYHPQTTLLKSHPEGAARDFAEYVYKKNNGKLPPYKLHQPAYSGMDSGNKKALNTITAKHELDELRAFKELKQHTKGTHGGANRAFNWVGTSHLAPSVVLRESNAVKTLGAGTGGKEVYHRAKQMMHYMRSDDLGGEAARIKQLVNMRPATKENVVFPAKNKAAIPDSNKFEFAYGKTRLSRHAIKRIDQAALRTGHITTLSD